MNIDPGLFFRKNNLEQYAKYLEEIGEAEYREAANEFHLTAIGQVCKPSFDPAPYVKPEGLEMATSGLQILRLRAQGDPHQGQEFLEIVERAYKGYLLEHWANQAINLGDVDSEEIFRKAAIKMFGRPLEEELANYVRMHYEAVFLVNLILAHLLTVAARKAGFVIWVGPQEIEPGSERAHWAKYYRLKPKTPPRIRRAIYGEPERNPTTERVSLPVALQMLSNGPAQTVVRASRGGSKWQTGGTKLTFEDPINQHVLVYENPDYANLEKASLEELKERVRSIHPNTVDVWLLITAKSLAAWAEGSNKPNPVWVDVRVLAEAMGFKPHHKGGYRPEHLAEITRAIRDLASMKLAVLKTSKGDLLAVRNRPVILITGDEEVRGLFGESTPLRWEVQLGNWVTEVPKQFAPLFEKLVQLRGKDSKWTKNVGLELILYSRENQNQPRPIKVQTLLKRAQILEDIQKMASNRGTTKARDTLEATLDALENLKIIASWEYNAADYGDGFEGRPLADWLAARISVKPSEGLAPIKCKRARLPKSKPETLHKRKQVPPQ